MQRRQGGRAWMADSNPEKSRGFGPFIIQRPTPNAQRPGKSSPACTIFLWMLGVGCWALKTKHAVTRFPRSVIFARPTVAAEGTRRADLSPQQDQPASFRPRLRRPASQPARPIFQETRAPYVS